MSKAIPSDIASQTGPILLGNFFAYGLYGILVVQVCLYYHAFPNDNRWMKCAVWLTFAADTIMTICGTIAAWNTLAQGWGNISTIAQLDWAFVSLPCLSALVATVVHFFFCWRIWKLYQSQILPGIIIFISVLSFGAATVSGVRARSLGLARIHSVKLWVIIWLGSSSVADGFITILMARILFKAKRSTIFQGTRSGISKFIMMTVESGMAVTIGASIQLFLFLIFNEKDLYFLPYMLPKLCSNTLLATLNTRLTIGEKHERTESASGIGLTKDDSESHHSLPKGVQVSVVTERHEDVRPFPSPVFDLHSTSSYHSQKEEIS